jgi:hypothetical protein
LVFLSRTFFIILAMFEIGKYSSFSMSSLNIDCVLWVKVIRTYISCLLFLIKFVEFLDSEELQLECTDSSLGIGTPSSSFWWS